MKPGRRRRAGQAAAVAVAAVLGSLLWSPAASAETKTILLEKEGQAWFWSSNREIRQCVGIESQGVCQVIDGSSAAPVEPGHLGVALQLGASDMRAYIRPNLAELEPGSSITSMTLTLPVSRADAADTEHTTHHTGTGAKAPSTTNEARASISACAVMIEWGTAEGAPTHSMNSKDPTQTSPVEPFVVEGGYNCETFRVAGKPGAAAWTFDLTKIAKLWVDETIENNGIVLLPDLTGGTDSWRIEFHAAEYNVQNNETRQTYVSAKEAGNIRTTFTPPPPEPLDPPIDPPADPGGGVVVTPPVDDGGPIIAPPPADPVTPPQPDSEPVATTKDSAFYIWLILPLGLAVFSAFARAVGREAGEAGANRVAQVLRRRREAIAQGD